ncbi:MAG: aminotransferase class I/II-fold pyridoxal phosphate-dependent enzyme [Deltaproteobacteria bacterium]|nr:aminotransferase class I/II-fold pyridoxal phosphate-dependent enzyme [Deltaproteobacteria bacterium]
MNEHIHVIDGLSLGKIVQIRERLFRVAAEGKPVYRLESGDPSFTPPPHVIDAMVAAARAGKTHYIPNAGIPELRAALAHKASQENHIAVPSPEHVFVTHGAMHALFCAFHALLDTDDEVIVPDPMWTEVVENIRLARGRAVAVPLRYEQGYEYAPDEVERRITPRTKAIFVNTPHNPTGAVLSRETLLALVDIARRHDLWIVSDEAYEHVLYAPHQHHSIASLAGDWAHRVMTVFSFSKSHAMAGLRVGALVVHDPKLQERLQKVLRCTINGVNSLAQWGALAALQGDRSHHATMLAEYQKRRDVLMASLVGIDGVRVFEPRGTFFLWVELAPSLFERLGVSDTDAISELLCAEGVGNTPGDAFGTAALNSMRFAYSCDTAMVEGGAAILGRVLRGDARASKTG